MADLATVLSDLAAESTELDAVVAALPFEEWGRHTPAAGWTIADQIAHLAVTDMWATKAATDSDTFAEIVGWAMREPATFADSAAESMSSAQEPAQLLVSWRALRDELTAALTAVPAGARLPWFGPPMSATSMATARLMETWAHGQDVADALGIERTPTDRLRNVAHIGVRTRDFAFLVRGLTAPPEPFRVALTAPSGKTWTWGPDDAGQTVTGPALDFCLLVTQRRHRDDLGVVATGPDADAWLGIAQAYAGPPGPGREAQR